ncbi:hypothetical protein PHSY_004451 [Pseudozyma hubeiensis SY62]|uniref:Uncharacterized protein n=1 Tax=Pseudozyma hubeiensis (strain SY62) TaxID=1305764 RepID=R9P6L6_PSEHS|nr:hypothetical protein PHSY_004451 [Pseudozyma hubeiensis SY62]GAC96867.1 hypothetical protein PHSY_004451 [Pseudozyma hubeiensis SY62]
MYTTFVPHAVGEGEPISESDSFVTVAQMTDKYVCYARRLPDSVVSRIRSGHALDSRSPMVPRWDGFFGAPFFQSLFDEGMSDKMETNV